MVAGIESSIVETALIVIADIVYIVVSVFGLRAAKDPAKAGSFGVACIVALVIAIIVTVFRVVCGTFDLLSLVFPLVIAPMIHLAHQVRDEGKGQQ